VNSPAGRWIRLAAFLLVIVGVMGYGLRRLDARPGAETLPETPESSGVRLEVAFTGLDDPVHLAAPAGDPRIFIVEQAGRIRVARGGTLAARSFLDISDRVGSGGERGLLSVAFHPRFRTNGRFFVNYTDRHGDTHVAEFHADSDGDAADPSSERQLLFVRQPYANHNGGHVLFGPDGWLYVGMGDGGSAGDPHGNAQNPRSQLGKLLRIDVDAAAGKQDTVETWAIGLRNPWRIAFDSGLIYIADVGQGAWEEVDVAAARDSGLNYGWRTMEGAHCFYNPVCSGEQLVLPALEYDHSHGCSVIGGVVYRGHAVPALAGHYLYSDYCGGWLRSFRYAGGAATKHRSWRIGHIGQVTSFGEDAGGEVYILAQSGTVYRITSDR
jgi:glucose/arabinose dehydrogenase